MLKNISTILESTQGMLYKYDGPRLAACNHAKNDQIIIRKNATLQKDIENRYGNFVVLSLKPG